MCGILCLIPCKLVVNTCKRQFNSYNLDVFYVHVRIDAVKYLKFKQEEKKGKTGNVAQILKVIV